MFSIPTASISVAETSGSTNNDGVICNGSSLTLTTSGGTGYAWSTGDITASITKSPSTTTTYTVTVTNANGCTATANQTVTVNSLPSATISVSETSGTTNNDGTICNGASATLTASGGTSYAWSTGATTAAITPSPSTTTTYTVTVVNANGCSATANSTLTVNTLPTASISVSETSGTTNNDGTICNGASATLTASGGSSYFWSTGATTAAILQSPSSTSTYTVTVVNANGCSATTNTTLTVNSSPTASISVSETSGTTNNDGIICNGSSATLTASGGNSYFWSTGATTAAISPSPSATTTYTVTVVNANGCSATTNTTLNVNSSPTATISVSETSGTTNNDGIICDGSSASLTASGGSSYFWSTGATTAAILQSPSSTSTYTVTVVNANGCSATANSTLTVNTLPTASISVSETSGTTNNDGTICNGASATLTASGGSSYAWSTGATTASISPSPSATTTYTVTVVNANGCSATTNTTLTVNSLPTASISVSETSGTTNNDGTICNGASATLTASGGTSYAWSTGATTASITPSPSTTTTYTVTVVNGFACQSQTSYSITVNLLPVISISYDETSGNSNNDGEICAGSSITLIPTSGILYDWSTGATTDYLTISPTSSTSYTVTVTDVNGCNGSATSSVTVNNLPIANILISEGSGNANDDGIICNGDNITLTANGGTDYSWSTNETTAVINPSINTTTAFTVTVTDSNGCQDSENTTVFVNALPTPSTQNITLCYGESILVGGNTYSLPGVYTDVFTGVNGCDSVVTTNLAIRDAIASSQTITLCYGESITVGNSTYNQTGNYTDVFTSIEGCDSTVTTNLTVLDSIGITQNITICHGESFTVGDSIYSQSGIYVNHFSAQSGCDSTVTTNLNILDLITYTQNISLCNGETLVVGDSIYSESGTYTNIFQSITGCDSTVTTHLTIENPVNVGTTTNNFTITANANGATYQWINCATNQPINGATSQSYTATVNGTYAVIVTQGACSDTSDCVSFNTIGMVENQLDKLKVYPNPASTSLFVSIAENIDIIEVKDISGKTIKQIKAEGNEVEISVSDLVTGVYFIQLQVNGAYYRTSFVKQ